MPRYAVNCSIMLKGYPLPERLTLARDAGFDGVEFWWPFTTAAPDESEVERFVDNVGESGLQLAGLNLFAGDMAGGDRGVMSWPGREDELRASVETACRIGAALGCQVFNALYGNRQPAASPAEQDTLGVRNLAYAAGELSSIGATVLVEPVSGAEHYPLRTAADAVAVTGRVREETGVSNLGLLLDMYHLAVNGDDVSAAIEHHRDHVAHVQVADAPGRGAPGTGELPLQAWVGDLRAGGYDGWIALEHLGDDPDPIAMLTRARERVQSMPDS
ncbi:hydroxypyruvate isomerase [Actinobacteria bacterium YIM 96077]|uniref:Hydroxypyruvate isomerase n=1 Tax=Phytoactinopolyspora halophila TaxID=1981511 RepID=A0A329QF93_9ACTN|nr:TIM barrel protein [Phytoactinopolyspora halophila]AYY14067.1 hydroxypyruvate isomerase [Actinobacteria bacterium YIM 96077]RAW10974.1 hydroxypyruvate isomerase [Phytoactinopolyspora halophila]